MLGIIKHNIKLMLTPSYLIGWIYLLCLPILISFSHLSTPEMVKISEQLFILIGPIWFTTLLYKEREPARRDTLNQMPIPQTLVFLLRIAMIVISIILGFSLLLMVAKFQSASFHFLTLLSASCIGSLVLGLIALLCAQISNQVALGYMISVAYYYIEFLSKGTLTRHFHLFGLMYNIPYNKPLLLGLSLVLLLLNYYVFKRKTFS